MNVRLLLPPLLRMALSTHVLRRGPTGSFASWDEARRASDGYDDPRILERVEQSARRVRDGDAAFERDGVAFDHPAARLPLVAALLEAAVAGGGAVHVLDFGGSLASTYFQCLPFLAAVRSLRWSVIEQPAVAAKGRALFSDERLHFYDDLRACLEAGPPPTLLLVSGTLQFLQSPLRTLRELLDLPIARAVIDRTPVFASPAAEERLTVLRVPAKVYGVAVSYPMWIFRRDTLLAHLTDRHDVVDEFEALDGTELAGTQLVEMRGFLLRRRT